MNRYSSTIYTISINNIM